MTTNSRIDELEQQVLTLQRRLVEAEAKTIRAEQQLERVTIEAGIRDAVAKSPVQVAPSALPDVIKRAGAATWKAHDQHGLLMMDGGLPAVDSGGHYVTPSRWLQSLAAEAGHLFAAPAGADGASGPNPFDKATWNMTAQGKLVRENPALAKQLATQAGLKLDL
jgi:hypothetical protein